MVMFFQSHHKVGSLSHRFRAKRAEHIRAIIHDVYRKRGEVKILDLGGSISYWQMLADDIERYDCSITILNPTPIHMDSDLNTGRFHEVVGDARETSFPDMSFDLVHSNSVLEHVGTWRDMRAMAIEVRRLAPQYYVQVPYFWFLLEPHYQAPFVHWLPEQVRMRFLLWHGLGWYKQAGSVDEAMGKVQGAQLLDKRQVRELFPDAHVFFERFVGLPKSVIAIRR